MKDQYGRTIDYLRISITDLCNLRCRYCMPVEGIKHLEHADILRFEEIEKIAKDFVELGIKKIRITGGEPLVKRGILDLVSKLGSLQNLQGLQKLQELALTTNGILLKDYAQDLKDNGVKSLNISLDTLCQDKFFNLTVGGNLDLVLEGIEEAKKVGFESIKINTVLMKGINDNEINDFVNLTKNEKIDVRFIELMPLGSLCDWASQHFFSNKAVLEKCKDLQKLDDDFDEKSAAKYYKLQNAKGRVGIISSVSNKFCSDCNRVRLTADGRLKNCLHCDDDLDLKTMLRNSVQIKEAIQKYVFKKPKQHNLDLDEFVDTDMFRIGG